MNPRATHPSRPVWDIPKVAWHLSLDCLLLKEMFQEKNFSWKDIEKRRKPFLGSILEHCTELEDRGECVVTSIGVALESLVHQLKKF